MSENRSKISDFALTSRFGPKCQVEGVAFYQPFFSQKTKLNDLCYGIKIWADFSSLLSQFTRLMDRRMDRQNSHR